MWLFISIFIFEDAENLLTCASQQFIVIANTTDKRSNKQYNDKDLALDFLAPRIAVVNKGFHLQGVNKSWAAMCKEN